MATQPCYVICAGLAALLLAACDQPTPPSPAEPPASSLRVDGSAFVLTLADGRVLRGTDLVGATMHLALGRQ